MLLHIQFRLLSGWRECSDLHFSAFLLNDGFPQVNSEDGRICVEAGSQRCRISGRVFHYASAHPVEGTAVVLAVGDSDMMMTDSDGFYAFERVMCSLNDTVCASMATYPSQIASS